MSLAGRTVDRRRVLAASLTAAGALLIRFPLGGAVGDVADPQAGASVDALLDPKPPARPFVPNGYLRIDPDGSVTLRAPIPDMGQGTRTALPLVVAEELDVDWAAVRIEQADLDPEAFTSGQGAGGSDSLLSGWAPARQAGAAARTMLVEAAAARWGVPAGECTTRDGVVHDTSGRTLSYGALATEASRRPVPQQPKLKRRADFRLLGTRIAGVDVPAIVSGKPLYGLDVRLPQPTLRAAIAHAPSHGARLVSFDATAALALPGVRRVLRIDGFENPTHLRTGVAVLADSTWAAFRGRDALVVRWEEAATKGESSERLRARFRQLAGEAGKTLRAAGDPDAALASAARTLDVVYEAPFLAHACMEPMNCTAWVRDGRCDVWGPLQQPSGARRLAARAADVPESAVAVHPTRIGGGFGRRLLSDLAAEAAYLSRAAAAPVQVVWSREDDLLHDYYRPAGLHRIRAGLDGAGHVEAWHHRLVNVSRNAYRLDERPPESTEVYGLFAPHGADPAAAQANDQAGYVPFRVPHVRVEYTAVPTSIPTGAWRAPAHNVNAFVLESAIDELAHLAGRDALSLRLEILGKRTDFPGLAGDYDPDRAAAALRLVAERIGLGGARPAGRGCGIAGHFTFSSFAAVAVEVEVSRTAEIRLLRAVVAVDCGLVVNRAGVEAQAEGGVLDGLGSALWGEITVRDGATEQSNFERYRLLRLNEAPPVEVHILEHGDERPRGMGEIALPPAPPALANAIFAACGARVRRLPLAPALAELLANREKGGSA